MHDHDSDSGNGHFVQKVHTALPHGSIELGHCAVQEITQCNEKACQEGSDVDSVAPSGSCVCAHRSVFKSTHGRLRREITGS